MRDLRALPKAHLHLHFTGAMRPSTLIELADENGVRLPDALRGGRPPELRATDERGWFRFQRLYDIARSVLVRPEDVRRLVREVAEDEAADRSGWLEIQVDPSGYAARFGGLTPFVELVLDAVREASAGTGVGIALVLAINRTKHPLEGRTTARLAAQFAGRGVVGLGLSNDERRGRPEDFEVAFRIAKRAGLRSMPHGGELAGPASVAACLDRLGADRIGHGVRAAEDPDLLKRIVEAEVTLELCPASNVRLGVYDSAAAVPLSTLRSAGARIALGADDPLLFGARLTDQYALVREHHACSDADLAALARESVEGSCAPDDVRRRLLAGVDAWLAAPA